MSFKKKESNLSCTRETSQVIVGCWKWRIDFFPLFQWINFNILHLGSTLFPNNDSRTIWIHSVTLRLAFMKYLTVSQQALSQAKCYNIARFKEITNGGSMKSCFSLNFSTFIISTHTTLITSVPLNLSLSPSKKHLY